MTEFKKFPWGPLRKALEKVQVLPPAADPDPELEARAQAFAWSFPPRPDGLPCDVCVTCKRTVVPCNGIFRCRKCGDVWVNGPTGCHHKPKPDMVPDFILKRRAKVPARRVVPTEGLADMDHLIPDEVPDRFGIGR